VDLGIGGRDYTHGYDYNARLLFGTRG